jgi:asparagine synthase (glutamine-hydrolysing)
MKVQLPGLLHVDDRVTARFGMESRSPLLDQRLVRYVSTQPMHERSPLHSPRDLFRRAFAAHLPTSITNRSDKMGFPLPVDRWLKSELRDLVGDAFSSQQALERGYLSRDYAMRLADMRGVASREIFGHLMLELWHREYLTSSLADSEAKEAQGIA